MVPYQFGLNWTLPYTNLYLNDPSLSVPGQVVPQLGAIKTNEEFEDNDEDGGGAPVIPPDILPPFTFPEIDFPDIGPPHPNPIPEIPDPTPPDFPIPGPGPDFPFPEDVTGPQTEVGVWGQEQAPGTPVLPPPPVPDDPDFDWEPWVTDDPMPPVIDTPTEDEDSIDDVIDDDLGIPDADDSIFDDIFGGLGDIFQGVFGSDDEPPPIVGGPRTTVNEPPRNPVADPTEPDFDPPAPIDDGGQWVWDADMGDYAWILTGGGPGDGANDAVNNPQQEQPITDEPLGDTSGEIPIPTIPSDDNNDDDNDIDIPIFIPGGDSSGGGGDVSFTNTIGDFLSQTFNEFDFSDLLNQTLNFGLSDYAADQYRDALGDQIDFNRDIYNENVQRLDPYNQLGLRNISGAEAEGQSQPELRNLLSGQMDVDPNTNVSGPSRMPLAEAREVGVNQINPFDPNDPALRFLIDEGTRAVADQYASAGKLKSGGAMDAIRQRAQDTAMTYANQLQNVSSAQDQARLASDAQRFGQASGNQATNFGQNLQSALFDVDQGQQNIRNRLLTNDQTYRNLLGANNQDLFADQQGFNQLYQLVGGGQNAAANQGNFGNYFMGSSQAPMSAMADVTGGQYMGAANDIYDLFRGMF